MMTQDVVLAPPRPSLLRESFPFQEVAFSRHGIRLRKEEPKRVQAADAVRFLPLPDLLACAVESKKQRSQVCHGKERCLSLDSIQQHVSDANCSSGRVSLEVRLLSGRAGWCICAPCCSCIRMVNRIRIVANSAGRFEFS